MERTIGRRVVMAATMALIWVFALGAPVTAQAETAWIRGEIRLNLRTGPGNNYRIVDSIGTGTDPAA